MVFSKDEVSICLMGGGRENKLDCNDSPDDLFRGRGLHLSNREGGTSKSVTTHQMVFFQGRGLHLSNRGRKQVKV